MYEEARRRNLDLPSYLSYCVLNAFCCFCFPLQNSLSAQSFHMISCARHAFCCLSQILSWMVVCSKTRENAHTIPLAPVATNMRSHDAHWRIILIEIRIFLFHKVNKISNNAKIVFLKTENIHMCVKWFIEIRNYKELVAITEPNPASGIIRNSSANSVNQPDFNWPRQFRLPPEYAEARLPRFRIPGT